MHACAPPTGTPIYHAPRPKAQGGSAEHAWGASTCAPSCSRGGLPLPTVKGTGPLWCLRWCDGGGWPCVSLSEKAPVASPPPQPRAFCRGFSVSARLREQKPCRAGLSARTRPRWEQADAAAGPPAREREGSGLPGSEQPEEAAGDETCLTMRGHRL